MQTGRLLFSRLMIHLALKRKKKSSVELHTGVGPQRMFPELASPFWPHPNNFSCLHGRKSNASSSELTSDVSSDFFMAISRLSRLCQSTTQQGRPEANLLEMQSGFIWKRDLSFQEQGTEQGMGESSPINSLLTFEPWVCVTSLQVQRGWTHFYAK